MRRAFLPILFACMVACGNLWAGGLFPGTGGGGSAGEITYDNSTSGLSATNLKDAIDEVTTMAGTGGLASVDDLPGDTVDDTKIDVGLLPTGTTSSTVSLGNHTHSGVYQPADSDLTTWAGVTPSANGQALVAAANYAAMRGLLDLEVGTDVQAYDTDLGVLAGLTLTGNSKYIGTNSSGVAGVYDLPSGAGMVYPGAGVPNSTGSAWGTSYTVGTSANNLVQLNGSAALPAVSGANLTSVNAATLGGATFAAPGAIGGTTPGAGTFTTLSAGASGFGVDADGDVTVKSLTVAKVSGTAGTLRAYEANSTDTSAVGWMGPASISASWDYQFSSTQPAANSIMLFGAPSSNISAQTWATLDDTGTNGDTAKIWSADKCYDQDALRLALSGGTLTGTLITAASTTSAAGIRLLHGSAPTTPVNGDLWTTTAGLYARINGSTVGPFGTGAGGLSGSGSSGHMPYWNGSSSLTYDSDGSFFWDATNNRLGIGTTAPHAPLEIAAANISGYGQLTIRNTTASTGVGIVFYNDQQTGIRSYFNMDDEVGIWKFQNYNNGSYGVISLNPLGGNIGIGTTTATQALELGASKWLSFEGATADDYETTFDVTDPTADRTITAPDASGTLVLHSNTQTLTNKTLSTGTVIPVTIGIACSDESTALTTGTAKATFRMPHAMTLTAVRASVGTAPVGSTIIVDINEGGSTIMTTNKLSIDASEKTSTTAATAAGITDSALADDAEITIDIDQIGSSTAGAGLKVWLIGTRTL